MDKKKFNCCNEYEYVGMEKNEILKLLACLWKSTTCTSTSRAHIMATLPAHHTGRTCTARTKRFWPKQTHKKINLSFYDQYMCVAAVFCWMLSYFLFFPHNCPKTEKQISFILNTSSCSSRNSKYSWLPLKSSNIACCQKNNMQRNTYSNESKWK